MKGESIYWLSQAAGEVPADDDWLTASEAAALAGLRIAKRRADWRLGRWTAKQAVARSLEREGVGSLFHYGKDSRPLLSRVEILAAADGAPEARVDGEPARLSLSISHSAGTGLCAVAALGVRLGCDVETIESRCDAWAADFFTDEERRVVATAPAHDQARIATLVWSAKESTLKALREGLRIDTRAVVVRLDEGESDPVWRSLSVHHAASGEVFAGWWRSAADRIMTIVASPPPAPPRSLA